MTTTAEPTTRVPLDAAGRATLFTEARTANTFSDQPVSDEELADIWELAAGRRRRRTCSPSGWSTCARPRAKSASFPT